MTLSAQMAFSQASFERLETDAGTFGLSITNFGTLGKPDVRTNPEGGFSMRYPTNTGTEHLFEAGIWIGALYNQSQLRVSTASVTTSGGYARGGAGFEFTADAPISQRSTNPNDEYFSPFSVGEQDIIAQFSDKRRDINGTLLVDMIPRYLQMCVWKAITEFPFTENFTILRYDITNNSDKYAASATWDSVFIGMYADLVVRNVNSATETRWCIF